jgi:UDP-4-amino-4,6-dideoxy-N-acetyl-beta-L-altrosamine N-acetyltransferase
MITFRPLQREDRETIRLWRNLPQIRRCMLTDHVIGPEEHAAWFERVFDNPCHRHWIVRCEQEEAGLLNLYDIDIRNKRCYWGLYIVGNNVRGKSVGMFAEYFILQYVFEDLQFEKLCCETLDFNRGVLRMHQAFGFVEEGRLRRHILRSDGAHDVICLGIFRREWEVKRPQFEKIFRSKRLI